MIWTILGQDRVSGKLESFTLLTDGAGSRQRAFDEASQTVEVLAVIKGNHKGSITLYKPFTSDIVAAIETEEERVNRERFKRCSEYWEGI